MTPLRAGILIAHIATGCALLLTLSGHVGQREAQVGELRNQATEERQLTEHLRSQVDTTEAIRDGLDEDDPFVVELVARTHYGYHGGPDEVIPPPLTLEDDN